MGCGSSSHSEASAKDGLKSALLPSSPTDAVKRIVDSNLDVNTPDSATGELPLILAAQVRSTAEAFTTLLAAGANARGCAGTDGKPILFVLADWQDQARSAAVAELLIQHGLDVDASSSVVEFETALLTALKAFNLPLARVLIAAGAQVTVMDHAGNTPLHVAAAIADMDMVGAILQKSGDATTRNCDDLSPIMSARLGVIGRGLYLQEEQNLHWTPHEKIAWDYSHPMFPRNHEVAAVLALSAGDPFSLTDAIEGAWLDLQAPPEKQPEQVHPDIMKAINALVHALQRELRKGLETKDADRLEAGLEMLWYAGVAQLPEEERAIKLLTRMRLERAINSRSEQELKQALLSATQYGQEASPMFKPAQEVLDKVLEERRLENLAEQLVSAISQQDLSAVHAIIKSGAAGLSDLPEYQQGQAFLEQAVKHEFQRAVASCDRRAAEAVCARTRLYSLQHLPEYQKYINLKKEQNLRELQDATASPTEDSLKAALRTALTDPDLVSIGSCDGAAYKEAVKAFRDVLSLPLVPDKEQLVKLVTQGHSDVVRKNLDSKLLQTAFQMLFDMTHRGVRTKDRRTSLPKRLLVKEVVVVQNSENLFRYIRRRERIRKELASVTQTLSLGLLGNPQVCKTFEMLPDGRQFHTVWQEVDELTSNVIDPDINEFYLFHGTTAESAAAITEGDFRLDLAGTNAGTLYGRGVYFAECASKSDEYAKADSRGLLPMLVCRVTLGRVLYTAEEYPKTAPLVKQCTTGTHHSVLGDREKCRGTFREMIVYDKDQAYPEFVVWYAREF